MHLAEIVKFEMQKQVHGVEECAKQFSDLPKGKPIIRPCILEIYFINWYLAPLTLTCDILIYPLALKALH